MRTLHRCLVALAIAALLGLPAASFAVDRPDPWITTKVKMALITADDVDGLDVNVDTVDGRVTLYGSVDEPIAKARAEELAGQVEGVREVRNLLQVTKVEEPTPGETTDAELRRQLETVLARDRALEDSDIEVRSVNQGVVLLGGEAATLSAHRRALEDAAAVEGVRSVESQIESPDQLGDEEIWAEDRADAERSGTQAARDLWITTKTKVELMTAEDVPFGIHVDTRDGVVTLFGRVSSDAQKQAAGEAARRIEGVKGVENELQVVAEAAEEEVARNDERIEEAIQTRLAERTDLDDAEIDVDVADGVARLTGTVAGRTDHLTALTVARDAQGVEGLVDDLRVRAAPAVSAEPPSEP